MQIEDLEGEQGSNFASSSFRSWRAKVPARPRPPTLADSTISMLRRFALEFAVGVGAPRPGMSHTSSEDSARPATTTRPQVHSAARISPLASSWKRGARPRSCMQRRCRPHTSSVFVV